MSPWDWLTLAVVALVAVGALVYFVQADLVEAWRRGYARGYEHGYAKASFEAELQAEIAHITQRQKSDRQGTSEPKGDKRAGGNA